MRRVSLPLRLLSALGGVGLCVGFAVLLLSRWPEVALHVAIAGPITGLPLCHVALTGSVRGKRQLIITKLMVANVGLAAAAVGVFVVTPGAPFATGAIIGLLLYACAFFGSFLLVLAWLVAPFLKDSPPAFGAVSD